MSTVDFEAGFAEVFVAAVFFACVDLPAVDEVVFFAAEVDFVVADLLADAVLEDVDLVAVDDLLAVALGLLAVAPATTDLAIVS